MFDIGGNVSLYGQVPQGGAWGRLRSTAEAGALQVIVMGDREWKIGDQLMIASTGSSDAQTENRTVFAVRKVASALAASGSFR